MIGLGAIFTAISNATALLDHLWSAFNNSGMIQAKVAQMSEDDKAKHRDLMDKAMHGTPEEKKAALAELQKVLSE